MLVINPCSVSIPNINKPVQKLRHLMHENNLPKIGILTNNQFLILSKIEPLTMVVANVHPIKRNANIISIYLVFKVF
jgi:hypothetical protein